MAIYHCSLKVFSRSKGHSAVAAAAYRSASMLYDERSQTTHRYDRRSGVAESFIVLPENTAHDYMSRAVLWNAAEQADNRKNSRTARELVLALPYELSHKQRLELTRDMALWMVERYRVAVDSALHVPIKDDDPRNHHAHLLFSTREMTKDGFGQKTRILDDKKTGKEETELIREVWETLANDALSRAGYEDIKIDRRSLEDQGEDRIPQTHLGPAAHQKKKEEEKAKAAQADIDADASLSSISPDIKPTFDDHSNICEGDDRTDNEDKDDEEGKETQSSSSGGGAGGVSPSPEARPDQALQSQVRHDEETRRKIDYPVIDQGRMRSHFTQEIKVINETRAAFAPEPLEQQITKLDRLMERLDKRVGDLERLQSKTTLPKAISRSIGDAVKMSISMLVSRTASSEVLNERAHESKVRRARQLSRYGRTYRQGLHAQIREMKSNIQILESKQEEYKRYSAFIDEIDNKINQHPSITTEKEEEKTEKQKDFKQDKTSIEIDTPTTVETDHGENRPLLITDEEARIKLYLKGEILKETVPEEFKPKGQKQATALDQILNPKGKPIIIGLEKNKTLRLETKQSFDKKPSLSIVFEDAKNTPQDQISDIGLRKDFAEKSTHDPEKTDPKNQNSYKQKLNVRLSSIDKALKSQGKDNGASKSLLSGRSEPADTHTNNNKKIIASEVQNRSQSRPTAQNQTLRNERSSWFIRGNEKTQKLQAVIDKEINKIRKTESLVDMRAGHKPQVTKQPSPILKEADINRALKEEGKRLRETVPYEYRAQPYERQHGRDHKDATQDFGTQMKDMVIKAKDKITNVFKRAQEQIKPVSSSSHDHNPEPIKMNHSFNGASGYTGSDMPEYNDDYSEEPKAEI